MKTSVESTSFAWQWSHRVEGFISADPPSERLRAVAACIWDETGSAFSGRLPLLRSAALRLDGGLRAALPAIHRIHPCCRACSRSFSRICSRRCRCFARVGCVSSHTEMRMRSTRFSCSVSSLSNPEPRDLYPSAPWVTAESVTVLSVHGRASTLGFRLPRQRESGGFPRTPHIRRRSSPACEGSECERSLVLCQDAC